MTAPQTIIRVQTWAQQRCVIHREVRSSTQAILADYNKWALEQQFELLTARSIGKALRAIKLPNWCQSISDGKQRYWHGIGLRSAGITDHRIYSLTLPLDADEYSDLMHASDLLEEPIVAMVRRTARAAAQDLINKWEDGHGTE